MKANEKNYVVIGSAEEKRRLRRFNMKLKKIIENHGGKVVYISPPEEIEEQNKEYGKWKNSVEGVLYDLSIIGDRLLDDDGDKVLIAKTLLKLPDKIRKKVLDKVLFVIMRACGTVENLKLSKVAKKEEFEFEAEKMSKVTIEQPLVILNFSEMKNGSEMDTIAHEIAHFILGHHINQSNPNNETEADDLVEKWGFKRAYGTGGEKVGQRKI